MLTLLYTAALSCFYADLCDAADLHFSGAFKLRLIGDDARWRCPANGSCVESVAAVNVFGIVAENGGEVGPECVICAFTSAAAEEIAIRTRGRDCGGRSFVLRLSQPLLSPVPAGRECSASITLLTAPATDVRVAMEAPRARGRFPQAEEEIAPEPCPRSETSLFLLINATEIAITLMGLILFAVLMLCPTCGGSGGGQSRDADSESGMDEGETDVGPLPPSGSAARGEVSESSVRDVLSSASRTSSRARRGFPVVGPQLPDAPMESSSGACRCEEGENEGVSRGGRRRRRGAE